MNIAKHSGPFLAILLQACGGGGTNDTPPVITHVTPPPTIQSQPGDTSSPDNSTTNNSALLNSESALDKPDEQTALLRHGIPGSYWQIDNLTYFSTGSGYRSAFESPSIPSTNRNKTPSFIYNGEVRFYSAGHGKTIDSLASSSSISIDFHGSPDKKFTIQNKNQVFYGQDQTAVIRVRVTGNSKNRDIEYISQNGELSLETKGLEEITDNKGSRTIIQKFTLKPSGEITLKRELDAYEQYRLSNGDKLFDPLPEIMTLKIQNLFFYECAQKKDSQYASDTNKWQRTDECYNIIGERMRNGL